MEEGRDKGENNRMEIIDGEGIGRGKDRRERESEKDVDGWVDESIDRMKYRKI